MKILKNLEIKQGSECVYDGDTDGCYLCVFGDELGMSESTFCKECKLTSIQYYDFK